MALQIRISPDALRAAAEQYTAVGNTNIENATKLEALKGQLGDAWDGVASERAIEVIEELYKNTKVCIEQLGENVQNLGLIANAFEAIDSGETPTFLIKKMDFKNIIGKPLEPLINWKLFQPGNIRIIPEQVRDVANQCRLIADSYSETENILQKVLHNLQNDWEGNAYNRFVEENVELSTVCSRISDELRELANELERAANRYEEIDNSFRF